MSAIAKSTLHSLNRQECYEHGVGEIYDELLGKGNTPEFSHMLAMRQPPGTKGSEQAFWDGKDRKHDGHGFGDAPDWLANIWRKQAKQAGISIEGKFYMSGLADKRGVRDPGAWVSSTSDVLQTARRRNLTVKGIVNHEGELAQEAPDIPLSENLIRECIVEEVEKDPGILQRRKLDDLRNEAIEKHGAPSKFTKKKDYRPKRGKFVDLDGKD